MLRFVVRRLLLLVPILLGLSLLVFLWIRALPGSPAEALLGERATPASIAQIRHQYGLDKPFPVQYWAYLKSLATLNFGNSVLDQRPVLEELAHKFPATVELALAAMLFAVAIGIPLGFFAAKRHGTGFDQASLVVSLLGVSTPIFFLAIILKYVFAVKLGWLPSSGWTPPDQDFGAFLQQLVLPAVSLGLVQGAVLTRYVRSAVLEVLREDFLRTARAKGLTAGQALVRHGLRNAAIPVITVLGVQLSTLLIGAVVIERVYVIPGLGSLLLDSVSNRDLLTVQGVVMVLTLAVLLVNYLVDVLYVTVDPRLRRSR